MNSFNKFFEEQNEEIILETKEVDEYANIKVDDDYIYEIDVYNNLLGDLPLFMQNNPRIQAQYLKIARHLIDLKNKSKDVADNLDEIEDYPDMKKIYNQEFNVNWIIPVVLDKKKIYKKLDINNDVDNSVLEQYVETASNSGIQYENFLDELKQEIQYIDEFQRDKLSYPSFKKLIFDIDSPYIIKKEMNKKEVGYQVFLNQVTQLFRYFNRDNKFWETYTGIGPEQFSYEVYDDEGKRIGGKIAQILSGEYVNIVGFLVFGMDNQTTILELLEGAPWCDRIRMIGEATAIRKNERAIVVLKNHGLQNGDKIMINDSNSSPSIDGEYIDIKIINSDEFMVPVNLSKGEEGTFCKVFAMSKLRFEKVVLNNKEDANSVGMGATLYLFPEENITDLKWKEIVRDIVPTAEKIIKAKEPQLKNVETIQEMNNILSTFSIEFKNLGYNEYFLLSEILESKYIESKKKYSNFSFDTYYGEIMNMREQIIGKNAEENVANDIIFGNKYILNADVERIYGKYPNLGTDVDSIATRYNWLLNTPDHGKFYFLTMELDKLKEMKSDTGRKEIEDRLKGVKKELDTLQKDVKKEEKADKIAKECATRTINPVKIYKNFNEAEKDAYKIAEFNVGDFALLENGRIFVWNGTNWAQNDLIKNIDDLCLLGVQQLKGFNLDKLQCLFKAACKNKKVVRTERNMERLETEMKMLEELLKWDTKELEKKTRNILQVTALGMEIYLRVKETTKKQETIEIYEQNIEPLYLKIMQIPDLDNQEYLRNLLIKKDGIVIDKNIYSIRTGNKICCGHYFYQLKISRGGSPEYSEKITQEMLAIYESEEVSGIIPCNNCGRALMLMEFDTAEGLSKTTGEITRQRETVLSEEDEFKAEILEERMVEKEMEMLDCTSPEIRNELLRLGFDINQIAKSKEICVRLNSLNTKTGIMMKKRDFIGMIADVLQLLDKMPDFTKFKQYELIKLKQQGVDLKQIKVKQIQERYNNLIIIRKITLIAARLLLQYQTLIPPQLPVSKKTSVVFESFISDKGIEYMALLVEEAKILPIQRETKTGETVIQYLQLGKVKEEVWKAYNDLSELANIKRMKIDRRTFDKRFIKDDEKAADLRIRNIPEFPPIGAKFQKEVEKCKSYAEFADMKRKLYERQAYIGQVVIQKINEGVAKSQDFERDDPKSIELSCCYQEVGKDSNYYSYIKEKTGDEIEKMIVELEANGYYYALFLNGGILMKHYPVREKYYTIDIENIGYNKEEVRKQLFITYIHKGIFKGEKHEYNDDGVCLLTGENKLDIAKKEYTAEEEMELLQIIIQKTTQKLIMGGTKEDENRIRERNAELVDDFDFEKMKTESEKNLNKQIGIFSEKMGKLLNKNKDFVTYLREKLENFGLENKILNLERMRLELDPTVQSHQFIQFENDRNRMKIYNLKKYINQYFRRYLSMIQHRFDPTEHIRRLEDMEEQTSKDIQKYIYEREHFIKKYMTKRDNEIFKPLQFDIPAKVIQNITADTDKWNQSFSKIDKIVNFNLTHLSHSLMYILMKNLSSFIENESGTIIAQFIMDVFDMIFKDMESVDFSRETFILGDYRTQEIKADEEEEEIKSDAARMITELEYKFRKISKAKEDFEEAFEELDKEEEKLTTKEQFIKEYKEKHDKDPTESEIMDYVDEKEKEKEADENEDEEEFKMKIDSDDEDALEKGAGYGEMAQGAEGGEDGDF
jgi:hypothetical protein